jgi:hypothetical protein
MTEDIMASGEGTTRWQGRAQRVQAQRDDSLAQIDPPIPELPEDLPARVINIPRQIRSDRASHH